MDQTQFAEAVLQGLGLPQTPANIGVLVAWENQEGGHWHNSATYNPLNTTMPMPGYSKTGTQGNIGAYTSWDQGIAATVKTLLSPLYAGIRSALAAGDNPQAVAQAVGASPWGTKGLSQALAGGSGKAITPEPLTGDYSGIGGTAGSTSGAGFTASDVKWYEPWTWGGGISQFVYSTTMYGIFGIAGAALVILGLWRGVAPQVQKIQQQMTGAAAGAAKLAAL